jgi:hypothetical protein
MYRGHIAETRLGDASVPRADRTPFIPRCQPSKTGRAARPGT